jgi:RTX calcium-binding nonapeptide repeat (4 copies)
VTVQTTSSAVGINPFTSGFTYILPNGIYVAADNSTAIFSFSNGTLDIAGSVIGFGGIRIGAIGGTSVIAIAATGTVIGNGSGGIDIESNYSVVNAGTILGPRDSGGVALFTRGFGSITNTGTILTSGFGSYGIASLNNNSTEISTLTNMGIISGTALAYSGGGSIDQITNSGTMSGDIFTNGSDDKIINYGRIYGNIDMGAGNDTVYTHLSDLSGYTLAGGTGSDTLVNLDTSGVAAINLDAMGFENYAGKDGADYVWAGSAAASLSFNGGAGNDAFVGGASSDYVAGGLGADYLDGGAGFNTVVYSGSLTGVTVNLFNNTVSGGDGAGDTILNFQAIVGSDNNDNLYGNNGVNYISGAGGNDVIAGFGGNDNLTGGAGNDIFYYGSAGFGSDEITDFSIGQDQAYISSALASSFGALTIVQSGINTVVTFAGGSLLLDNITATNLHASDFVFF